ncbi:MAG: zinc ribbon domain-containing protein [Desulfurococcales archaeon]|nr:zinc ribbon domain-containing protein [Desulfurococcales archaeon]
MERKPVLQVCRACGKAYYPRKARCYCGSTEFEERVLEAKGRIVTFTIIHVPPAGFQPPLKVAIADFGVVKILGRLEEGYEPGLGDQVEALERDGVVFLKPVS